MCLARDLNLDNETVNMKVSLNMRKISVKMYHLLQVIRLFVMIVQGKPEKQHV